MEYEAQILNMGLLDEADTSMFLGFLYQHADSHLIYFRFPVLRDADDEMILELAIKSGSRHIVTFNTRNFHQAREFGISIVKPKEFLQIIGVLP